VIWELVKRRMKGYQRWRREKRESTKEKVDEGQRGGSR